MSTHQEHTFDDLRKTVGEYAAVLRRRWRPAVLAIGLVSSVAFWCSQYLPRQYSATTIFERRDDTVLRNLIQSNSPYSFTQLRSSLVLDMTGSRALASAAIATGLLPADTVKSQSALSESERRAVDTALGPHELKVSVVLLNSTPSLDTIELRCQANDPAIARAFVIALRDGYIQRTQGVINDVLQRTCDFFKSEVARYQGQVTHADQALKSRFAEYPGVDPTDPASAGAQLEMLRAERDRLTTRQAELDAEISARQRFLTSVPLNCIDEAEHETASTDSVHPSPAIERAIAGVEAQINDAMTVRRMTAVHPDVKALQVKLDALLAAEAELRANIEASRDSTVTAKPRRKVSSVWEGQQLRVEMELDALRQQLTSIGTEAARATARYSNYSVLYDELVKGQGELQRVEAQLQDDDRAATIWRQHLAQLERIMAAQSEERGTQFTLIEEPREHTRPTDPRLTTIIAVCAGCGLAVAGLVVAILELLDRSFRSLSQVSRSLSLPVLECVGVIDTPVERRRRLRSRLIWGPTLGLALASLAVTATLACVSIQRPDLHRRAISKIDGLFRAVGVPTTQLVEDEET
ncbi:MAG: hypothetical protein JXO22_04720 [Phycisphaerae bacterium]|nr:hypothetical protein [Phycisphaerae bacterium]